MRRGGTAAVALALSLACALPTTAGGQAGELIIGAGSFNEAPLLEPGRYRDTIRGSETNIYAIDVQPGQRAGARVELDPGRFESPAATVTLDLEIDTPARTPTSEGLGESEFIGTGSPLTTAIVKGPVASDPLTAAADDTFPTGGRWYVRVSVDDPIQYADREEFPITLDLDVAGTPTEEVDPPVETEEPVEPDEPEEPTEKPGADAADENDGGSGDTLLIAGIGGVLLGGVAGVASSARSRNRRTGS